MRAHLDLMCADRMSYCNCVKFDKKNAFSVLLRVIRDDKGRVFPIFKKLGLILSENPV